MARLDTQINQIYYLPPDANQVSLILTDEVINNNSHLFVIADLVKIAKKTEANDLKKISEIILSVFQENKKLTGETLFETSLAAINQDLADFAHKGKKSWLGKFSALIGLKTSDNIYLSNSGQMGALLYRGGDFSTILDPEKPGLHPLKTFSNFMAGKLKVSDVVLMTTSNLFSYVALDNLSKMMSGSEAPEVSEQVAKIIKDTAGHQEGFASFFITMAKPSVEPKKEPATTAAAAIAAAEPVHAQPIVEPMPEEMVYAPLPSKMRTPIAEAIKPAKVFGKIPKISVPKFSVRIPKLGFWEHLSPWAKFFLISFLIFLLLFASNIMVYTVRKHNRQTATQTQTAADALAAKIGDAESALIYRNQDQALKLLAEIETDLANLRSTDPNAASQYEAAVADLSSRINHITVVRDPQVLLTLKHPATELARAGAGFVIADSETDGITTFKTGSNDASGKDLFLLNNIGTIKGLAHIPNTGNVVITNSEMYLVDSAQNEFQLLHVYPKTELSRLRFLTPDRIYTIDRASDQVLRVQFSKQTQNAPVNLLKTKTDLAQAVDIGVDTDVWVLFPTELRRYANGNLQSFRLTQPTDQITSATRLVVANNIYILESAKKRLLIYNKQGALVTQIFFPNAIDMKDLYVDETGRNIYILDSNKLLSITF